MDNFPATNDNYIPSISSRRSETTKVLRADFGDGYSQRAIDGINNIRREFSLVWRGIPITDGQIIVEFFQDHGGAISFLFPDPMFGNFDVQVVCEEWNRTPISLNYETITATFTETYDL